MENRRVQLAMHQSVFKVEVKLVCDLLMVGSSGSGWLGCWAFRVIRVADWYMNYRSNGHNGDVMFLFSFLVKQYCNVGVGAIYLYIYLLICFGL